jgi:hypothetical protein
MPCPCNRLVTFSKLAYTWRCTWIHLPLAVAVKVRVHAVPSHAAGAELQSGLRTAAGLVANPVTGRARVAVYEILGPG